MTGDSAGTRTAFLVATHFIDDAVLDLYRKVTKDGGNELDVAVLCHDSASTDISRVEGAVEASCSPDLDLVQYSSREVWDSLDLNRGPFEPHDLFPGAVVLAVAHFAKRRPDYDFYWFCEYDVRFTGRWRRILDHFAGNRADLLATTLVRRSDCPDWSKWRDLAAPARELEAAEMIRGFFPFYRISARALDVLVQAFRAGWKGHHECSMPTVLYHAGLVLEDIGGQGEFVAEGNENRFYTNTPTNPGLSPGTFVFRPIRAEPGDRRDTLWHPVKPAGTIGWEARTRRGWLDRLRFWA